MQLWNTSTLRLAGIDQQMIQPLQGSQADAGLGSHIAAGAGESVHG